MLKEPLLMQCQDKPFNDDSFIKQEFIHLRDQFNIKTCIELGTCLGVTSEWFADTYVTVKTVEINPEFLHIAKVNRLNAKKNVITYSGSSVDMLPSMLDGCNDDTMIFIDSHWGVITPAPAELELIAAAGIKPVIAVHDFQVPNRPDLGFDKYDVDKPFNLAWLKSGFDKIYGADKWNYYYNTNAAGAMRGIIYVTPNR